MNPLGMPTSMFLVFMATILAGSLGAMHYLVVHVFMGKPFGDEEPGPGAAGPGAREPGAGEIGGGTATEDPGDWSPDEGEAGWSR